MRLFDMLCNHVFPDDARIAEVMGKLPSARALKPDEVRTYLRDDPGQGWIIPAGTSDIVVTLEHAPVRACAIRMTNTDGVIDKPIWQRLIAAAQARAGGGFTEMPTRRFQTGNTEIEASGAQKPGPHGAMEAFYLFTTAPKGADGRARSGVEIRMVRQLVVGAGQ